MVVIVVLTPGLPTLSDVPAPSLFDENTVSFLHLSGRYIGSDGISIYTTWIEVLVDLALYLASTSPSFKDGPVIWPADSYASGLSRIPTLEDKRRLSRRSRAQTELWLIQVPQ